MIRSTLLPTLLVSLAALACGPRAQQTTTATPEPLPIEALRARAAASPNDPALQAELAEAELLWPGGESGRARPALDRALALSPDQASLHVMNGWLLEEHGQLSEALDAYARAVELSRASDDAFAPLVAEHAIDVLGGLRGATARYDERVVPILERTLAEPARLGSPAVELAAGRLMQHGWRQGDDALVDRVVERVGCVKSWRAVGPFGPYALSSFDVRLPAEGAGPLAERYDLGEGLGEDTTFEADTFGCRVDLAGGDVRGAGSTIAESFLEIAEAGPHVLVVDTPASFKLSIDGREVFVLDRRDALHPSRTYVPVTLTAGRHEVELKLTARGPVSLVFVVDRPGRLATGYDPARGVEIPEPRRAFERALSALVRLVRGDRLGAREVFRPLVHEAASGLGLELQRRVAARDPFLPNDQRQQLQQRLVRQILERDPNAAFAALEVAQLEQGAVERSALVRAVAERWPDIVRIQLAWAEELQRRDQLVEAEAVLDRVRALVPDDCGPIFRLQRLYRTQLRVAEANALVDRVMECDASSRARYELFVRQRRWDDARAELARLKPLMDDDDHREIELALAIATEDTATEARVRAAMEADAPPSGSSTLFAVDALLARGRRAEAIAHLDRAMESDPAIMSSLRHLRRDLTGRDDLEPHRVDGAEIIRRYEASEVRHDDARQVLVFDYMVTRVYPDGSSRSLIHQILKVQSEESVEELGQLRLGGQILTLHSIKPDGRRLEPEAIAGVDSIPMTDLAIGDYVEYEFVVASEPRHNGGFRSNLWLFDSQDQPFAFSQMVALVPSDATLDVEALGGTPAAVETRQGELRVLTWTMEHVPTRPAEPNAAPIPPYRPTLRFAVNAGWEPTFAALREALLDRDHVDPEAVRFVRGLVGEERDPERVARILHRWVTANVEPANAFLGIAPIMLAQKQGDRNRVLRYLLRLAGLDARLVASRRFGDQEPTAIADDSLFTSTIVQVRREGAPPLYVWGDGRHGAFELVPPAMRGQEAVVLTDVRELERVVLPDPGPQADRHVVTVDVGFDAEGVALVEVREEFHGVGAFVWRNELERVPAAEMPRLFAEAYVPRALPGAEVIGVEVEGREDFDAPFALRYAARVRGLGRSAGDQRLVPPLFATPLARAYASLPSRRTAQKVDGRHVEVTMRVHGVRGDARTLPDVSLGVEGLRFQRQSRREGEVLIVQRALHVAPAIVPADAYPAFASMVRQITDADMTELPVPR
ncbi:MAG: DUF3857 domain-containing protein [Myxococcales bacterium]|nr:DUF3857 domain-containing protein [Myxococcales bacterium]